MKSNEIGIQTDFVGNRKLRVCMIFIADENTKIYQALK